MTLHAHLLKTHSFFASLHLQTSLVLSYATCLHHTTTLQILTNFLTSTNPSSNPLPFNAIISNLSRNGFPSIALHTFSFMHFNSVPLDTYGFCSALTAASSMRSVGFGRQMHAHVEKLGLMCSVYVGSALIDMYAKGLVLCDAYRVFDEMPVRNVVCGNALISGFTEGRMWVDGLNLARKMRVLGMEYDRFTLCGLLRVCAGLSKVELGRQVHGSLIRSVVGFSCDVFLQSSLIDMYGRCGVVEKARHVFNLAGIGQGRRNKRDVVLWTSMLGTCARNGQFKNVIELFEEMLTERTKPDKIVFLAVISACGHTGNVSLGLQYFESMVCNFGLDPDQEHYSCVVDLLCRAGELEKAWEMVSNMPFKVGNLNNTINGDSSVSMWGALLSACTERGNVEMGKLAAEKALEVDPQNVGIYVLWSNLCASVGMWGEIEELRDSMRKRGLMKDVGCSWVEVTG